MQKPFSEWTTQDAQRAITAALEATVGSAGYEASHAFIEKRDHWQAGAGWVGPGRDLPEGPLREAVLNAVQAQFSPVDALTEVLDRAANGLMQREAELSFVAYDPAEEGTADAEAQAIAAAELRADVGTWWDRVKLWQLARTALIRSRWAGRGALRLWIAPGSLIDGGDGYPALPQFATLWEALEHVQLTAELPGACYVYTDPETLERCAITLFDRDGKRCAELAYIDPATGETVIRQTGDDLASEIRMDLAGVLPVVEMAAPVLISESARALQRKLNYEASLHLRSSETAGFPERYVANAEPEGEWLDYPPASTAPAGTMEVDGTTYYLHARPRTLGASISTELRGVEGEDGKPVTPSVTFREPTDPEFIAKAAEFTRALLLRICRQGHVASAGTAEASGVAYQQARADFEADLASCKGPLEGLVAEVIVAAIALAEAMVVRKPTVLGAGATSVALEGGVAESVLDDFRPVVTAHVNAGPDTPDEQRVATEQHEKGVLPLEDVLGRLGVEDIPAALSRLDADPRVRAQRVKAMAEAMKALTDAGAGIEIAARLAGFDEADAKALARGDYVDGIEQ